MDSYLLHDDPDLRTVLAETRCELDCVLDTCPVADGEGSPANTTAKDEFDDRMPLGLLGSTELLTSICLAGFDFRDELYDDEEVLCELAIYPPMHNTVPDAPPVGENEILVFQTSAKSATRRIVVQRDDDLLTPTQVSEHWNEVQKARLKELATWNDLKCFSRKLRRDAHNIIDTRWVIKFKWVQKDGKWVRIIRARLTLRGFKDSGKHDVDRYAGTSSRSSQKVVVSEAVARKWDILSADISKAFLQGVTYAELAELTGSQPREINFYLPAADIPLLRSLPGFEGFDPQKEVLHSDKPGTGLADAPRAFQVKLVGILVKKCGMHQSKVDNELCFKHDPKTGMLVCIMTIHVDDLKIAGEYAVVQGLLTILEQ